jgi:hypothetical protein
LMSKLSVFIHISWTLFFLLPYVDLLVTIFKLAGGCYQKCQQAGTVIKKPDKANQFSKIEILEFQFMDLTIRRIFIYGCTAKQIIRSI